MPPWMNIRLAVGVTFVIAVAALVLHLRPLLLVPNLFDQDSFGAQLQRECESVVDTAGVQVRSAEVLRLVEEDPILEQELQKVGFSEKFDYVQKNHPERWNEAFRELTSRRRDEMIRSCVLERGTKR